MPRFSSQGFTSSAVLSLALTVGTAASTAMVAPHVSAQAEGDEPTHTLVLRDGRTVNVRILEEAEETLKVELVISGIRAAKTYQRSEILAIEPLGADAFADDPDELTGFENRVYVANLVGDFGRDISPTPIDRIMRDAAKNDANIVVLHINSEWKQADFSLFEQHDDFAEFDQFWATERFVETIWEDTKDPNVWPEQPRIIFWVNRAMGGLAFLPMTTQDVFFTADGQMGGIGNLDQLFEGKDEAFVKKQQALRRTAVEGWLIDAGHDPIIGNAMMQRSIVLSYRIRNGEVEFLRNMPSSDPEGGWTLLTDDGEGENEDTDAQIVRKQANDVLTLRAPTALALGFSKGTVETTEDILFELGLEESGGIIDDADGDGFTDAADRIVTGWSEGIDDTIRRIRRMQQDLEEITGENSESRRINMLNRMIALINQYGEVLDPQENLRANYRLQIDELRNQQQIAAAQRRAQNNPRGNPRNGNNPRNPRGPR